MQKLATLCDITLWFILHGVHLPIISISARCLMTTRDICARTLPWQEKLQSDWCRSVGNADTSPRIASHQTLSSRVRVWPCETNALQSELALCYGALGRPTIEELEESEEM